jgi:hypothetical protein
MNLYIYTYLCNRLYDELCLKRTIINIQIFAIKILHNIKKGIFFFYDDN